MWCGVLCLYILILVFVNNDTVMLRCGVDVVVLWVAILRLCCVVVVELQCGGWSCCGQVWCWLFAAV